MKTALSMATNNLTPKNDLLAREFYDKVASDESLFPDTPAKQRQLKAILMQVLGYGTPTVTTYTFGQPMGNDIREEWIADTIRAQEALNDTTNNKTTSTSDTSQSTTDSEVREAVLREDV